MIEAFIFDLDGVIVSTDRLHYEAWKTIADQEHIEFNESINNRLRGVSRMESLDIILEKGHKQYSLEDKDHLATLKNTIYRSLLKNLSPNDVLPGVIEVLHHLKEKGIKVAIGSSSKNAPTILAYIGLTGMFDAIADGNDITRSKPFPDVFLKAAEKLNVSSSCCLVVEDAEAGIEAAKRAGMKSIALSDARKSIYADYRFDDIRELLSLL
jgi:beta-phosphoglucomutase